MKGVGWRIYFLLAIPISVGLAQETVSSNDLKAVKDSIEDNKESSGRSGALLEESDDTVANSELKEVSESSGVKGQYQQSIVDVERLSEQNEYDFASKSNQNVQDANQLLTYNGVASADLSANQELVIGTENHGLSLKFAGEVNAYSRLIPHKEHILLHRIPGATNILTCTREGELHNFWSPNYQCLVCACVRDSGLLRPVCASCGGCTVPSPEPYTETPIVTLRPVTIPPPYVEEVTCKPLPRGQPFENPLHPCQICICIESLNAYGQPDVQIECQENPQCVLPPDAPIFPIIPDDVPVHSHFCDKFPLNVLFPHPSDSCKACRCSVQLSPLGQPERLVTCIPNPDCNITPDTPVIVPSHICDEFPLDILFPLPSDSCKVCRCSIQLSPFGEPQKQITCAPNPECTNPIVPVPSSVCDDYPLDVPFPLPSDACTTCRCSVQLSPLGQPEKVMVCAPNPNCIPEIITETPVPYPVTPDIIPITPAPFWPPVIPPGPLPGPSPHDSCRPYVPNQPFDHPWDECQMCICTEAFAKKHVTVEINCFTKKSCCIESPFDLDPSATLAPVPYKPPANLQFEDAICEYKTFGVEFPHPKELCVVCTCEVQGRLITPFCKRSSKPECQLIGTYTTYPTATSALREVIQENAKISLSGSANFNQGSSGLIGLSQSSSDRNRPSYNQWNIQKFQRPGGFQPPFQISGGQNYQNLGEATLVYGSQNRHVPGNQFGQNQGAQNYYTGSGYSNSQGYSGYPTGLFPSIPSEVTAQAQAEAQAQAQAQALVQTQASASASASSSASNSLRSPYGYAPGSQFSGGQGLTYPGLRKKVNVQQFAQSSASAQASATTSFKGRSGNPDDNNKQAGSKN